MASQGPPQQNLQPPFIYRGICGGDAARHILPFPSRLSLTDKAPSISLNGAFEATYTVARTRDAPGSVRSDHPVPARGLSFYYFEMTVLDAGEKSCMSIGLEMQGTTTSSLPGWQPNSYGYHASDGRYLNGTRAFATADINLAPHGKPFTTGDTVGLAWDLNEEVVFFTLNGLAMGDAFDKVNRNLVMYPAVGLNSPGERVAVNFGQREFEYPLEQARFTH